MPGKKKEFNVLTDEEIKKIFNSNVKNKWDIYDERAYIESLFGQRFNFFILSYSLILTAAAALHTKIWLFTTVLLSGIVILACIWSTLCRAHVKLDISLRLLFRASPPDDIIHLIDKEARSKYSKYGKIRINKLMAHTIPALTILSLFFLWIAGLLLQLVTEEKIGNINTYFFQ